MFAQAIFEKGNEDIRYWVIKNLVSEVRRGFISAVLPNKVVRLMQQKK